MSSQSPATLGGVVVHWRDEEGLERLLAAWPADFPLVVVDNSDSVPQSTDTVRAWLTVERPESNLGFGGGVNRGLQRLRERTPRCRFLLILNPDAAPEPGAVETLLSEAQELGADDRCAGIAPALRGEDGETQHRWQLQPLPSALTLLGQIFFIGGERGPLESPPRGTVVEQPAAAVLLLDLQRIADLGERFDDLFDELLGDLFDPGFFPAWFDDVDLARRLSRRGLHFRYAPAARFFHARGSSVPALGYGRFLWIYYRNLQRYLAKHHGAFWSWTTRALLPLSMVLRLTLLPLRKPTRATSRSAAATGLLQVAVGAATGWRFPRAWAKTFSPRGPSRA